ncbi:MAG: hypothetical protein KDE20_27450 [Caldilineaceae bacterium]|nr:hypothetical protein [Caldilineaceae bacterium]
MNGLVVPNAITVAGSRSTSGDGTAVIIAPGAGTKIQILDGAIKTATPGEAVTATLKADSTELYSVACTSDVFGVATLPYMSSPINVSSIYIHLSDAIEIDYTLTYVVL